MKKIIQLSVGVGLLANVLIIHATDLMQVYQDAYNYNPNFLSAKATMQATMQGVPIARAGLLPEAMATGQDGFHNFDNDAPSGGSQTVLVNGQPQTIALNGTNGTYRYNEHGYEISASQPLFNFANWLGYSSAKYSASSAASTFNAALQTLMSTTAQAYFAELNAEDTLSYVQAEKQATYESLTQAKQKFDVGLIAITDVEQARAQYDSNVAAELSAQNDVINAKENLHAITGMYYEHLASLHNNAAPLIRPIPVDVNKWVEVADKQNWTLIASRQTAEAARRTAQQDQANHLPTVDGVASYTGDKTGTTSTGQRDYNDAFIGVQVTVPIFENGMGYTSAVAKQAGYQYEAAVQNRDATYLSTVNNTKQNFNNVLSFIGQVEADKQTIKSNQVSLQSIIDGYSVGTQTMLDVLTAQENLFSAWSDYSDDQYSYINATIALKQAAGTLSPIDLQEINSWLTEQRQPFTLNMYTAGGNEDIKRTPLGGGSGT